MLKPDQKQSTYQKKFTNYALDIIYDKSSLADRLHMLPKGVNGKTGLLGNKVGRWLKDNYDAHILLMKIMSEQVRILPGSIIIVYTYMYL